MELIAAIDLCFCKLRLAMIVFQYFSIALMSGEVRGEDSVSRGGSEAFVVHLSFQDRVVWLK